MFAVVKTGGKQYKVAPNDVLRVEKLAGEAGAVVEFGEVLMLGGGEAIEVGAPRVEGAVVRGEVIEQIRGEKVISFKKRRRTNSSQRRRGHRQYLTVVRITDILAAGAVAQAEAAAEIETQPPETQAPETQAPESAAPQTAAPGTVETRPLEPAGTS